MDNPTCGGVTGVPFLALIAEPVSVVVPGPMHASGRPTSVPAAKLVEDALEQGVMGLTFEGPTL